MTLENATLRTIDAGVNVGSKILGILLRSAESEMYADVLELVLKTFESRFGFFGYIDEDGALVCPSMTRDIWEACSVDAKSIAFPRASWSGLWGRVLIEKKSLYKNEFHRVPKGHIPLFRSLGSPILYQGELIGSIHVANRDADYTDDDIALLESITSVIAPVLSARIQRNREDAKRRAAEEALHRHAAELARSNAELEVVNQELQRQLAAVHSAQETIKEQALQLRELSTPVVQVWDRVLVAPLIGALDVSRMDSLVARLLELIVRTRSRIALIDITGLPIVDTQTAQHLLRTTAAVRLLGAQVVLTGVRPAIAETMVHLDLDFAGFVTRSSLADGLRFAFDALGLRVVGPAPRG